MSPQRQPSRGCSAALVAGLCSAAVLAAEPDVLHQGIAHDALYDVCFDARGGVAVGAAGVVLTSSDAGASWQPQPQEATPLALLGVACGDERRLAVGQTGIVLIDDGKGWRRVESGTGQRLLAVAMNGSGLAVAVGGFGAVMLSRDRGESWEPVAFDWPALVEDFAEPHLYDVAVAEDGTITLVGEFEIVMRSPDGGASWARVHKGDASLFGLHIGSSGAGYAVGQEGRILRSSDGGASWEALEAPVDAPLLGVWASADDRVMVSGMRTMLAGSPGGASWNRLEGADIATGWYAAVASATGDAERIVSVGNAGRVLGFASVATAEEDDDKHKP